MKSSGYNKAGISVNPDGNRSALLLYERLGFIHDKKDKYLYGVYDGIEDWVIDLEKILV